MTITMTAAEAVMMMTMTTTTAAEVVMMMTMNYDDRRRSRYDDDDDYDDRRRSRYDDRRKKNEVNKDTKKIMKILMVVAGVVIALLIMFLVGNAVGVFKGGKGTTTQQTDSEMVKVPDVTGKTYEEAQKELNKYDLGIHKINCAFRYCCKRKDYQPGSC